MCIRDRDMGIPLKLIKLANMAMRYTKAKIKYKNILGESFTFNKGIKQADGLSATLLIIAQHLSLIHICFYFKIPQHKCLFIVLIHLRSRHVYYSIVMPR